MIWGKIIQKLLIILPQIILPSKIFAFLEHIEPVKELFLVSWYLCVFVVV